MGGIMHLFIWNSSKYGYRTLDFVPLEICSKDGAADGILWAGALSYEDICRLSISFLSYFLTFKCNDCSSLGSDDFDDDLLDCFGDVCLLWLGIEKYPGYFNAVFII